MGGLELHPLRSLMLGHIQLELQARLLILVHGTFFDIR